GLKATPPGCYPGRRIGTKKLSSHRWFCTQTTHPSPARRTLDERRDASAGGRSVPARLCRARASRSRELGFGTLLQRHGLELIDTPLRFLGDILGVPPIEHRGNARGAFRQLLARRRIRRGDGT